MNVPSSRFLEELESDILEECCQCGKVKRVLSLDEKCGYSGCVAVTFYERGKHPILYLCSNLYLCENMVYCDVLFL